MCSLLKTLGKPCEVCNLHVFSDCLNDNHTTSPFLISIYLSLLQARDIYEEAIETVLTVRDFTQVFDAYAEFEKNVISAKIQTMEDTGASEEGLCLNSMSTAPFSELIFLPCSILANIQKIIWVEYDCFLKNSQHIFKTMFLDGESFENLGYLSK